MSDLVTEYNEFKKFYKINEEKFGVRVSKKKKMKKILNMKIMLIKQLIKI